MTNRNYHGFNFAVWAVLASAAACGLIALCATYPIILAGLLMTAIVAGLGRLVYETGKRMDDE